MNGESSLETYTLPDVKYLDNGICLREFKLDFCTNIEECEVGGRFKRKGMYV